MKKLYFILFILAATAILSWLPGCSAPPAAGLESAQSTNAALSSTPSVTSASPAKTAATQTAPAITEDSTASAVSPDATATVPEGMPVADGFYYTELTEELKTRITGMSFPSDPSESAVTYGELRYVRLKYYDFEGNIHDDGELIVHAELAAEVAQIFYELFEAKYPFTSIRLVDDYGEPADDNLSMAANNTSAFNYRYVTGTETLSRHSYGAAIDVNPRFNPYINGDRISPENGAEYADRSLKLPGMIDHDDLCYRLLTGAGWNWGGDSDGDKDYQHFSKDIGQ